MSQAEGGGDEEQDRRRKRNEVVGVMSGRSRGGVTGTPARRIVRAIRPVVSTEEQQSSSTASNNENESTSGGGGRGNAADADDDDDNGVNHQIGGRFNELVDDDSEDDEEEVEEYDDEDDEEDDDDDDDDDYWEDEDDNDCDCPDCTTERMMRYMMRHQQHHEDSSEDEDEEEDTNNSNTGGGFSCAICLSAETRKRKLAVLPCCGGGFLELTSSMQFCEPCVHKSLLRSGEVSDDRSFMIGPCPRCKHLLASTSRASTGEKTLSKATFRQKLEYVFRKDEGSYNIYLAVVAWCHNYYLPEELLDLNTSTTVSQDRMHSLVQWGILKKRIGKDIYYMEPQDQEIVRNFCVDKFSLDSEGNLRPADDEDTEKQKLTRTRHLCFFSGLNCAGSGFQAICKWKFVRCVRLWNRGLTLFIVAGKMLPVPSRWSHGTYDGWLATGVNVFGIYLIYKILVQAFWVVLYLGTGWLTAKVVGTWIAPDKKKTPRWLKWLSKVSLYGGTAYLLYRTASVGSSVFSYFWHGKNAISKDLGEVFHDEF